MEITSVKVPLFILLCWLLFSFTTGTKAQGAPKLLPTVIQHAEPVYPALARQARIEGEVQVNFTTNGESVIAAEALSGHPLLAPPALDNVRTWKFAPHDQGNFTVTFRYRLQSQSLDVSFLQSPGIVELRVSPPPVIIDYADVGFGRWKGKLKSARGNSQQIFDLFTSGPEADGVWLEGRIVHPPAKDDEIDYGYLKDDLLGFTVNLAGVNKIRVRAFFVGKLSKNKIVGTFVDEDGVRGQWTATREGENIVPR
jgi:TonB family protein